MLITLLKNCDRVKIACLAQLVNVIAPIMTENGGAAWRQTIFYPFMHAARHGHGVALSQVISSPAYDCTDFNGVPYVETIAVHNRDNKELVIFAVNRAQEDNLELTAELQGFTLGNVIEFSELSGHDVKQANTKLHAPVVPKAGTGAVVSGDKLEVSLKPLSWNMIRIKCLSGKEHTD